MSDSEDSVRLPWWAQILIGATGVGALYYFFNIFELLHIFLIVVVIPTAFIACSLLGLGGVFEGVVCHVLPSAAKAFNDRVATHEDQLAS